DREHLLRSELPLDPDPHPVDRVRGGVDLELGRPSDGVAGHALQRESIGPPLDTHGCRDGRDLAVPAYREHVAERRLELELDDEVERTRIRVQHADSLTQAV